MIHQLDNKIITPKKPGYINTAQGWSVFDFELWRDGKLVDTWLANNATTTEGFNKILNVNFHGAAAITTWYIALFEDDYTPLVTDTYAVPVFTESTAYTEATRQAWVEDAAASASITNSTKAAFTMNATKNIYGAALMSNNTKGDKVAAGAVMYCAAKADTVKPVENGDVLKVGVTISYQNV